MRVRRVRWIAEDARRRSPTITRRPRLAFLVLLLGALYCLAPVAWVVIAASKTPRELFTTFSFAPGSGLADNLASLRTHGDGQFWRCVLNSPLYAGVGGIVSTLVSAMAGYAEHSGGRAPRRRRPAPTSASTRSPLVLLFLALQRLWRADLRAGALTG
jgi:ABC-type Fe3+ transport system permease subunit